MEQLCGLPASLSGVWGISGDGAMDEQIRVVVLGTGQMGSGMIKLLLHKHGIHLVGVYGRRASRAGTDVGQALGLGRTLGVPITNDLPGVLGRTRPHVVLQATCSRVVEAVDEITAALRYGANVISIAEEMAFPACQAPHLATIIHQLALDNHVTVVGTGINPGFVLDLLVIALTGVCWQVDAILAQRINDLAPYGPSVLASQGVGLTPEAFYRGVADGSVVGHRGFPESISLIAQALGWEIDRIVQHREPIIARVKRSTPFVTVEPGCTAGCLHRAVAYRHEKPVITLIHPQQVHPHLENVATGDRITIHGEPPVHFVSSPEIPGGLGTVALAVNMIPAVMNAPPGLTSMAALPVPAAIMGDVRTLIHDRG
jgi:4-hydroxy-tetrahydrodipicolinate reductase